MEIVIFKGKRFLLESIGGKGRLKNTGIDTFQNFKGLVRRKGNPETHSLGTVIILDH